MTGQLRRWWTSERLKKAGKLAWAAVGSAGLALAGLVAEKVINPFGMVEAIEERSGIVVQQVAAPLRDSFGSVPAPAPVTVILIDQQFLSLLNDPRGPKCLDPPRSDGGAPDAATGSGPVVWPLPVNVLLRCVIDPIAARGPAALFLDIAFQDVPRQMERGDRYDRDKAIERLADGLSAAAAGGGGRRPFPLLIADDIAPAVAETHDGLECVERSRLGTASLNSPRLIERLFDPDYRASPPATQRRWPPAIEVVNAGWHGSSSIYPLVPQRVNCTATHGGHDEGDGLYLASPAQRLWDIYRQRGAKPAEPLERFALNGMTLTGLKEAFGHIPEYPGTVMTPYWSNRLSPATQAAYGADTDACGNSAEAGIPAALRSLARSVLGGEEGGEVRKCVYIDTVRAGNLLGATHVFKGALGDVGPLITERLVLVGLDLPASRDEIVSPINGPVPGVYAHAAALENLIRYRGNFRNKAHRLGDWAILFATFLLLPAITRRGVGWLLHHIETLPSTGTWIAVRFPFYLALLVGVLIVQFFSDVILFIGTSLPPGDAAIPLIFAYFPAWHRILEWPKTYLRNLWKALPAIFLDRIRTMRDTIAALKERLRPAPVEE